MNVMERDRAKERSLALVRRSDRLANLMQAARDETLGDDVIRLAQVMILCTLPYSRPSERSVSREARLGDGSRLVVTFTAGLQDVSLPFGSDRRLMAWLLDRSIRSNSRFIEWASCWEYQKEMGLPEGGSGNRAISSSFERLSGLAITIRRHGSNLKGQNFFLFKEYVLPSSIHRSHQQLELLAETCPYGVWLDELLFDDIRRNYRAIPFPLWKRSRGPAQVHDMVLWFYVRCYEAQSESLIPWEALASQFSRDSNRRRQVSYAREAIQELKHIWPGCSIEAIANGILVDKASRPLLPDDPSRNRVRLLK